MRYSLATDFASTLRPGLHSHNRRRCLLQDRSEQQPSFHLLRSVLLAVGLACGAFYIYNLGNQFIYQRYENWVFEQQIAGQQTVAFSDFLKGFFVRARTTPSIAAPAPLAPHAGRADARPLAEGDVLGRVSIQRLNLSAVVREGVSDRTLAIAVGHVSQTARPGQLGNVVIAAHRDTLFRVLKDIRLGDQVTIESPEGTYRYGVLATKIVKPSDVAVLRPDGGGVPSNADPAPTRLLTMITCYPFYYVGSAPKRFIVQAGLIETNPK